LNRPGDFYAEMLKSDRQMDKVKGQLIKEQTRIKKFEEKKQKLQNIKFAKAVIITIYFIIFIVQRYQK
jgi:rRNA-processing protein EBP2